MPEGAYFGLQIEAEDKYGNGATSFTGRAHVTIALTNPASATGGLSGGPLTVAAVDGVANFQAFLTQTATSSIIATSSPPLMSVTTNPIVVTSGTSSPSPTPNTDTHADANTDTHADANTDPHADTDPHTDPHADTYTVGNRDQR